MNSIDPNLAIHAHTGVFEIGGFLPLLRIGHISLPIYFIVISFAFSVSLLWLIRRTEGRSLDRNTALDLSLVLMASGFIGARLFHVVFEEPAYYLEAPLRILEFWKGGFVWFGGALLGAAAFFAYLRWRKLPAGIWLDLFAPIGAFGYLVGRLACLMTGCCYGGICVLASGFQFRHPTQLYAIATEGLTLAILLFLERRRRSGDVPMWLRPSGRILLVWIVLHALGRLVMEAFRDDPRGPIVLSLSLASWISVILILGSIAYMWREKSRLSVTPTAKQKAAS